MNLQNKKVVILGGTSGIGLAVAHAALAQGATVIISSSNQGKVAAAVAELGPRAQGRVADLTDAAAVDALFAGIGAIDHLVYTAGDSLQLGELGHTDLSAVRNAFEVRVFGAIAAVKAAAPYLQNGGSITLTSGVASARPQQGWTAGASICGAMEGFMRALAVELAPIRVNIVSPGFTRTPLWSNIPDQEREAMYSHVGARLPVGRVGEADDVAQTYLYLMNNAFATGQVSVIDGGGVLI
ncbi:NAD(P)-dependent dehydrogenase, short-chain alcohol dehydrogenase family [Andreprevotia lacus DSM 23236]|jgi:NAD(P)-dependent dehydrogenase (short-subunit alcohol dehydrogenase family)|uniref:NAD(P)-dependent dehydrogenase, short-chain alcohol dehydrogenase family n=1 Tax=Andreprevotia lacus DSM 23236 TaxID=1121001 RepID=A0A1W1Y1G7_9NEIS|nr:SDR family oxidoreductase [Andreprevotia lacus]SMC29996.1 NAD(P)-dependent dehydrogenase, short-chain alcohol dehydrogenase family [Andreprevotia lacus DSM 23236]